MKGLTEHDADGCSAVACCRLAVGQLQCAVAAGTSSVFPTLHGSQARERANRFSPPPIRRPPSSGVLVGDGDEGVPGTSAGGHV